MLKKLGNLITDLHLSKHLKDFGIKEKDIPALAKKVMKVTRLLANNPRTVNLEDAENIYRKALYNK